jgi:hypothetical protein
VGGGKLDAPPAHPRYAGLAAAAAAASDAFQGLTSITPVHFSAPHNASVEVPSGVVRNRNGYG